jgi:Tfp pilus assembly protein PilO
MPTDQNHDERTGQFRAGNVASLRHGFYSQQVQAGTLEAQGQAIAAMAESQQAIVNDLGGDSELSQLQRDMVRSYLRLGLIEDFAFANVEKSGVFTTKGAQRAVVSTLMKAIAQRSELAKTLGLSRRAKRVEDLRDYLASRERA